ncbi:MAG: hypothetical protein ACI8UO_003491 [Verrucomicrobiales bacterium]|jgi:hypothetical protein
MLIRRQQLLSLTLKQKPNRMTRRRRMPTRQTRIQHRHHPLPQRLFLQMEFAQIQTRMEQVQATRIQTRTALDPTAGNDQLDRQARARLRAFRIRARREAPAKAISR